MSVVSTMVFLACKYHLPEPVPVHHSLHAPSSAWSAASGVGPVIGGSFAQDGHWRWLFCTCKSETRSHCIVLTNDIDMNIPFAGLAAVLVLLFVKLPTPPGSIRSKLEKIDWM